MARMSVPELRRLVDTWVGEFSELGHDSGINSVQIFENRGAMMGCSNAHPHGQIWANETLPNELAKELAAFGDHRQLHGTTLLNDYVELELGKQGRLVAASDHCVALLEFATVWLFGP